MGAEGSNGALHVPAVSMPFMTDVYGIAICPPGADLKEACAIDPKSKEIRDMYTSIKQAQIEAKAREKELFATMINNRTQEHVSTTAGTEPADWLPQRILDAVDVTGAEQTHPGESVVPPPPPLEEAPRSDSARTNPHAAHMRHGGLGTLPFIRMIHDPTH